MKQQYVLVQCLECQLFQVHIEKKKTPAKFTCAVCRCIQTIKRIFAKSSKASDCRKLCQEYNARSREQPLNTTANEDDCIHHETAHDDENDDAFDGWDGFVSEDDDDEGHRVGMHGQGETQVGCSNHEWASPWGEEGDECATHPASKRKRDGSPLACRPRMVNQYRALSPRNNTERLQQTTWEDKGHSVLNAAPHARTSRIDTQNGETAAQDGDAWFTEYLTE